MGSVKEWRCISLPKITLKSVEVRLFIVYDGPAEDTTFSRCGDKCGF